jgi:hypothetical protein
VDDERLRVSDQEPLGRRRLAVLLRALLVLPPLVVIAAWSVAVAPAIVFAWVVLLSAGRLPAFLHRFLTAYVRYAGQTTAWFYLLSGRYPNPIRAHSHPFVIELPDRPRQPRLVTLVRAPLAIPALVLASALRIVLSLSAVAAWFAALALGRTTAGLQELGTFCLRYELETVAYLLLLTSRYPRLAPE